MKQRGLEHLDESYLEMLKEQEILRNFETILTAKAKELINQHYPKEIYNLSPQGYRQLENVISLFASNLAIDISHIIYSEEE